MNSPALEDFPEIKYKSTLLSIMNFFGMGNGIWVSLLLGFLVVKTNTIFGHALFGICLFALVLPLLWIYSRQKTVAQAGAV
jgi:hypothetical protein